MPFTNMKLKSTFSFSFFLLSLLLLVSSVSYARKDLEAYWEKKMKGLPMPELIKDLSDADRDLFVRDFDMKPNVIIYHSHVASKDNKNKKEKKKETFVKKLEAEKLFREEEEEEDKLAQ
ncbi:hypothetical protein QN277_005086 [Acacia crassicarpa]|uniref:Organ specific protein n=1 Tax=Acacia crassicarpa TaxID=499986 RepID=A0AAE1IXG6_9FABA|nr:hypothetical protein QN277_005086 [Acacia crassicarpa]